jgi:hypothetical protein
MERVFLGLGIAICLFCLWAIGRNDLLRVIRPARRVIAEVSGHRSSWEDSSYTYATIYRFHDETGEHEVIDPIYRSVARPDVGTRVELAYPKGRPDLARRPQALLWVAAYALFATMTGILIAKMFGWIGD